MLVVGRIYKPQDHGKKLTVVRKHETVEPTIVPHRFCRLAAETRLVQDAFGQKTMKAAPKDTERSSGPLPFQ